MNNPTVTPSSPEKSPRQPVFPGTSLPVIAFPKNETPSSSPNSGRLRTLIDEFLSEQQNLSAVESFAQWHTPSQRSHAQAGASAEPARAKYYRSLLPATPPQPGEQYGFEVNLDLCSGCKACVTACHELNGLDENESFRDVGLLLGGSQELPVLQHATTACHHCLDPACLSACPTNSYEKHPVTGVVKHLDDQCFGCQYCILACPYDVPKYNPARGIVRKCDLCTDRLAHGEAPACVQACPHQAIKVQVVEINRVKENAESNQFLPGAFDPRFTLPTTSFHSDQPLAKNLLPANHSAIRPEHAHWPLVIMLVLTQWSVGAFLCSFMVSLFANSLATSSAVAVLTRQLAESLGLLVGLVGLIAATLHLGRPHLAFRGVLGWRHSWLSREAIAFGVFSQVAVLYVASRWNVLPAWPALQSFIGIMVLLAGLAGVFCSAMVYVFTRRAYWSLWQTFSRFAGTTLVLGAATTILAQAVSQFVLDPSSQKFSSTSAALWQFLLLITTLKLLNEVSLLTHLHTQYTTPLKRTALLLKGDLKVPFILRLSAGLLAGVVIPGLLWGISLRVTADAFPALELGSSAVSLTILFFGEVLERYLFFSAVVANRMPGAIQS